MKRTRSQAKKDTQVSKAAKADAVAADLIIRSQSVVLPDGIRPSAVFVKDGKILAIGEKDAPGEGKELDVGQLFLMPGVVDSHVHINEPGRTHWEGFHTATQAAAAGVVDMPLNSSPVTTSVDALNTKISSTKGQLWIDLALLGGIIPGNAEQIIPLIKAGVVGFKAFMIHSGLDEFPHVKEKDIRTAMEMIKKSGEDVVFMFHAEVEEPLNEAAKKIAGGDPKKYHHFLHSRPRECENQAIRLVIALTKEYGIRSHIVHLSSSDAVDLIREARAEGVRITAETTYHYLHFTAEQVPDSHTLFKCCPPIREAENREKLWKAVQDGVITQVVSDHSPCTVDLKKEDFDSSWGGISSLQLGLPIIWTECKKRGLSVSQLVKWMCEGTSALVRLDQRKGKIAVGYDADFCIWDPTKTFTVTKEGLYMKNKASPYLGEKLHGVVHKTILAGHVVFDKSLKDHFPHGTSRGMLLIHGERKEP